MKIGAMKVRIGILEDDACEAKATEAMLSRYFASSNFDYSVETFSSAQEFLQAPLSKFDLFFLDILLDGESLNGVDIAQKIREQHPTVPLVFLTKSLHFAVDGYKVNAVDYIVKPLVYEEFLLKMHKILDVMVHTMDKDVILKTVDGVVRTRESEIVYLEVIKHYLHFHLRDGRVNVVRGAMKEYADALSTRFARSGNSFLVNLSFVAKIGKADVYVRFDEGKMEAVPLTRSYREDFLMNFSEYCGA